MRMCAAFLGKLLVLLALFHLVHSCPHIVQTVCRCEDLHNGVSLNCSDANAAEVIQILKDNQAMLGLIQSLTMQRANIVKIPPSFLSGLYIKKLDLSYNKITQIDDNAFSGMSPVMQELILHHNHLTHIPVLALGTLKTLLKLDLSNNTISDIRADDGLPSLPKLFDVNLGSNNICLVHKTAFENIKNSVQAINLGHNCLKTVPSAAIRGFKQLMALHMHRNSIQNLDNLAFMNLPVLNLLNLAGNKITEIRPQAFLNVPNLRYLYLTDNKVTSLMANQFAAFDQLEMLDLTSNFIEAVPKAAFSNLPQLRQLYLGQNRIAHLAEDSFANSSMVILVLSGNKLTTIDDKELSNLPNLQQISFKDNQINTLHPNAFYNIPSIVMIDLSQNELSDLPPSTFMAQLNLLLIDLTKNKIIRTPYAAFNRRVGTVLLQENPLVCTEKVHMLQDGVGVFIPNSEDIVCGGTPRSKNTTSITTTPMPRGNNESSFKQDISHLAIRPVYNSADNGQQPTHPEGLHIHKTHEQSIPVAKAMPGAEVIPVRPIDSEENEVRPQLPTRTISRSRNNFGGSEIAHMEKESEEEETETTENNTAEEVVGQPDSSVLESERVKIAEQPVTPQPKHRLGARVYTDIADNPNIIHPFPVPFLKRGPMMSKSSRVHGAPVREESTSHPLPTLPPTILIAPRRPIATDEQITENKVENDKFEEFTLETLTNEPKEVAVEAPYEMEGQGSTTFAKLATPTTIIIICLSTVGIVMVSVFVGLCVARHRTLQRLGSSCSDSTAARTNAYVAAQSAQLNMIYGTAGRTRSMSMSRPDDNNSQPWVYTPGAAYHNYYNK